MSARAAWLARALRAWLEGDAPTWEGDEPGLAPFQQAALRAVGAALGRYGGALLADEVGLGKTHVALAALRRRGGGLVLAPAALLPMWREALRDAGLAGVALASHAALAGARPLAAPAGLLVVDEAQAFVQPRGARARALAALTARAPTLLLTATPVGMSLTDLCALIELFAHPLALLPALGEPLERWLARGGLSEAPERLLRAALIRRPRALIERRWPGGVPLPDGRRLRFPTRRALPIPWGLDEAAPWLPGALSEAAEALSDDAALPAGLFRALLLSRAESSLCALERTLARLEGYLTRRAEAAARGQPLGRQDWRRALGALAVDEDLQQVLPLALAAPDAALRRAAPALAAQAAALGALRARLGGLDDPKASILIDLLRDEGARAVLWTRSVETARWLWGALCAGLPERGVGLLDGAGGRLGGPQGSWAAPPQALLGRLLREEAPGRRLDLLVATDVLSEGVNLQRCGLLISVDLPWNPRRLIQRQGRADRLGLSGRSVTLAALRPEGALEEALGLTRRAGERAHTISASLGDARALSALLGEPAEDQLTPLERAAADLLDQRLFLCASPPDREAPPGWALPATRRDPPGALLGLKAPGWPARWFLARPPLPPDEAPDAHTWRLLRELTRRDDARPLTSLPDPYKAVTDALCRHLEEERAASLLAPWAPPPERAQAAAQRLLAQAPWPRDRAAAMSRSRAQARLRSPLSRAQELALEALLSTTPDAATLERWLESNTSPAPPRLDAGPVALFAFLLWR